MNRLEYLLLGSLLLLLMACSSSNDNEESIPSVFTLQSVKVGDIEHLSNFEEVDPKANITLLFSDRVDEKMVRKSIYLENKNEQKVGVTYSLSADERTITITPVKHLLPLERYSLVVQPTLKSVAGKFLDSGKVIKIETVADDVDKFPQLTDDELLTKVQKSTFSYFWEFGHPVSGMARERSTSENTVTTGGTGFGIQAMLAAESRGFITRDEAADRVLKIASFLRNKATHYHGAFAHWINGTTGETVSFGEKDNGADLVETSLLFQGLLSARAYFDQESEKEQALRKIITELWEGIEWTHFVRENVLYWHWSPEHQWEMNLPITGWNESLIVYVLAASSPTYPIDPEIYHSGWAKNGKMKNGKDYYGITLPLGEAKGGPLFLSQYSFLGLNPKQLSDQYANYWEQVRAHTLINRAHCIVNPNKFKGYSEKCWGITAGDGDQGYSAYSPLNDKGVITPTAALTAIMFTPEESLEALHYFYYKLGDKLWGDYGFYDGFNLSANWFANQYIAINQGPIVVGIENYRTGLLWNVFMGIPEVKKGLSKLGFIIKNN